METWFMKRSNVLSPGANDWSNAVTIQVTLSVVKPSFSAIAYATAPS